MKRLIAVLAVLLLSQPADAVKAAEIPESDYNAWESYESYSAWIEENENQPLLNPVYLDDPFEIKRLIVKTSDGDFSFSGVNPKKFMNISDDIIALQFNSVEETREAFTVIGGLSNVVFVEPDSVITAAADTNGGTVQDYPFGLDGGQYFSWGVTATGMDLYLDRLRGLPEEVKNSRGRVGVAVLDSGINIEHPMFRQQYIDRSLYDDKIEQITDVETSEDLGVDGNAPSESYLQDLRDLSDNTGHGSHVAGIILDCAEPFVEIVPIKVLTKIIGDNNGRAASPDATESAFGPSTFGPSTFGPSTVEDASYDSGYGYASVVSKAIRVAADDDSIKVINLSIGYETDLETSHLYDEAINYAAVTKNKVVVVAAGNTDAANEEDDGAYSPAHNENVIAVAAVNDRLEPYANSKHGAYVDISAPGEDILSVSIGANEQYITQSGTSQAAPHVSALAALILYENTDLTADDVKNEILSRAYAPEGWNTEEYGSGILKAMPAGETLNEAAEKPYISGRGNYIFAPDSPIYRLDIYQMVYRLHSGQMNYNGGNTAGENLIGALNGDFFTKANFEEDIEAMDKAISDEGFNYDTDAAADSEGVVAPSTFSVYSYSENSERLTRADFVTVLYKIYDFGMSAESPSSASFTDLDEINTSDAETARQAIELLTQKGIVNGYPDGTFKPNEYTTRAEAVKVFSLIAERNIQNRLGVYDFNDVEFGDWAYNIIMNAAIAK